MFEEPFVEFHGPASVRPDENGRPVVEMIVERSNPPVQSQLDLTRIEFGLQPAQAGQKLIRFGGGSQNMVRATVRGAQGVFQSGPDWSYTFSWPPGEALTLRINPSKSEFVAAPAASETLIVLPLSAFVSEFPACSPAIRDHPLNLAIGLSSHPNGCIPFEVGGQQAFIQQLPDRADIVEGMRLTAVAVLPMVDPAMVDPWGWFLTTFLRLLELAAGSEINTLWIELRDENGRLARRLHIPTGHLLDLKDGYGAIRKALHWSAGEYLTAALSSPLAREPFFSIALRHCVRAGLPGLTLDDQLDHLVRALECLTARYGFSKLDLLDGFDPQLKIRIGTILNDARVEIDKLVTTVADAGHRVKITRIAGRAQSAAQTDRSFGLAVENLTRHFGLRDAEVLGPYYVRHPGPGRDWVGTLSYYRGAVLHEGFVDIDSPAAAVGEVLGFVLHLHDLLVRLLLKIVGYRGTYQPRLIRATAAENADWFKPGVRVDSLLNVPTLGLK